MADHLFDELNRMASSTSVPQVRFCFSGKKLPNVFISSEAGTSRCSGRMKRQLRWKLYVQARLRGRGVVLSRC